MRSISHDSIRDRKYFRRNGCKNVRIKTSKLCGYGLHIFVQYLARWFKVGLAAFKRVKYSSSLSFFLQVANHDLLRHFGYEYRPVLKTYHVLNYAPRHEDIWGSWNIAPHISKLGAKWKWMVSFKLRPITSRELSPDIHLIEDCVGTRVGVDAVVLYVTEIEPRGFGRPMRSVISVQTFNELNVMRFIFMPDFINFKFQDHILGHNASQCLWFYGIYFVDLVAKTIPSPLHSILISPNFWSAVNRIILMSRIQSTK
jgi:hypothetical protein